jgi:hypothetical protein
MLLYKNGRIYEIERRLGESRHEFMLRCWYLVNGETTSSEAIAWSSKQTKNCSYGILDDILIEKAKHFTK